MTAPKRRWFRYSLRTMFVVVTACALISPAIPVLITKYHEWQRRQAQLIPFPDDEGLSFPTREQREKMLERTKSYADPPPQRYTDGAVP